jgi:uncharacterized protein YdaU (DUF1376 family)
MPLYVADYLADTAHLSTTEHGAYLLLIMHYWTKGKLPADEDAIRRITRLTSHQWTKSRDVLASLFLDGWRHKRIDDELSKALEKSKVNSANAKRSHDVRTANAERTQTQSLSQSPKEDMIREPRAAVSVFTPGSKALAGALWKALGITHALQIGPELAGADWRALEWEKAGWPPDMIEAEARRIGPGKPLSYYEKCFATSFAKRQAPLPVVEVLEAEKLTVVKNVPKSSPFDAAYERVLEKLNAGFAGGAPEERDGPPTGEDHARLLAYRQRQ